MVTNSVHNLWATKFLCIPLVLRRYILEKFLALLVEEIILRDITTKLPHYMRPSCIINVVDIPVTPNGKIDKHLLCSKYDFSVMRDVTPPHTKTEKILAKIWKSVLHVNAVGIHDEFFALGGSSIKNIMIVDVAKQQGLAIDIQDIFTYETIHKLAAHIDSNNSSISHLENALFEIEPEDTLYLSPNQRFLIRNANADIDQSNVGMTFHIAKCLTQTKLADALQKVIANHSIYGWRFKFKDGEYTPVAMNYDVHDVLNIVKFEFDNETLIIEIS